MRLPKELEEILLRNPDGIPGVLKQARDTYGSKNQILVCIEELNELACVLAKYPRYDNEEEAKKELYDAVLDEFADVMIILDHVQSILQLSDEAIHLRILKKVNRLSRWLENSTSMQRTVEDRAVELSSCKKCQNYQNPDYTLCNTCMSTASVEGVLPYYKEKKGE